MVRIKCFTNVLLQCRKSRPFAISIRIQNYDIRGYPHGDWKCLTQKQGFGFLLFVLRSCYCSCCKSVYTSRALGTIFSARRNRFFCLGDFLCLLQCWDILFKVESCCLRNDNIQKANLTNLGKDMSLLKLCG